MVGKIRSDLCLAFPGKGKEIEHYGMNSPLHLHISSLILSTCEQIQHFGFFDFVFKSQFSTNLGAVRK